jgi:glycerol-3-phosphate acyltransferase PlsY
MSSKLLHSILWTGIGFLSGSLMFAFWGGKLFLKKDIRNYGTGNPGAVSAWKAGGWKIGVSTGLLELAKGLIPVALAIWVFGVSGWYLVPVALAPILGHAFSPFLKFKGGRATAVTLGVWTAITIWEGMLVLGVMIGILYIIIDNPSWANIWGMLAFLVYLLLLGLFVRGLELHLLVIWAGNIGIMIIKHWSGFFEPIKPRPYIARFFKKAT